ncbi:hypothetical protein BU687_04995 [Staphylococcus chromogenes]|uniref:hypothetical protein n=1 Tax=Staphylococcus chromogenes TaxID=46126 RepID=UPI000D19C54A|nr:hypothetical protein [Staphylococcus chromogenes]PTG53504.1 hypothetical protein BU687_04995 [Staphylococcus chromogenes]
MAKMKVKKEMTLAELIQWGNKNEITNKTFINVLDDEVRFVEDGWIEISDTIHPKAFFKVEEEITEDTKIPVLVGMYKRNKNTYYSIIKHNTSIISEKDKTPVAFYMLNDDMTMTLIWRNGGMVE